MDYINIPKGWVIIPMDELEPPMGQYGYAIKEDNTAIFGTYNDDYPYGWKTATTYDPIEDVIGWIPEF